MNRIFSVAASVLLFSTVSLAQLAPEDFGIRLGPVWIRPEAQVKGAYDDRVFIGDNGDTDGDLYSEMEAAVYLENDPAQVDLSADAGYGYRFYQDYTDLDSDFYQAGASVATAGSPLQLGIATFVKKTLDYDTVYGRDSIEGPAAILTGDPSTRYGGTADIAYEKNLTDKTSITPGYDYWYYFQNFEKRDDAEWQVHRASLRGGYGLSEKTRMFLTGYCSLQVNDDENGTIGGVTLGAEGEISEKTSWYANLGVAVADYENSGTDQGVVGRLQGNWRITDRFSAYAYGLSDFQPGYSGGDARRVYRLGYGADWRIATRWSLRAQALHDYQEELGSTAATAEDEFINAFLIRTEYDITDRLAAAASFRYVMDEEIADQSVAALSAVYRY